MGSLFLLVDSIIAAGLLILSLISLIKGGFKNRINQLFSIFSLLIAVWIVSNHVSNDPKISHDLALFSNYLVFASSLSVSIILCQFISKLSNSPRIAKIVKISTLPLWIISGLSFTPFLVKGIIQQGEVTGIEFGPGIYIYLIGVLYSIGLCIAGLVYGFKNTRGVNKRQIKSIAYGIFVSVPLVVLFSLIIPVITGNFEVTEFGITPLIVLVGCLYYGVVRYGLFDIKLAAVRTVAYALSLVTLSVAYYFLALIVSVTIFKGQYSTAVSISPVNIALALILAFIFQPVKKFFDKITNKIFYRDRYDSDEFFARLNRTLSSTTDLHGLLERAAYEISMTLKADHAFFFIFTSANKYLSVGTSNKKHLLISDVREIQQHYGNTDSIIVASLLNNEDPIRKLMISHKLEIILPLAQADQTIGYLCLGYHKTAGYKDRDIKVLETISDELNIAVQNALSIEEVRDLNANLQHRVDSATKELRASNAQLQKLDKIKDEFVSIASHQLRTPLTSVKGYISMVLEGDAGEINDNQRKLLDEAFNSSERMVHLIGDFLNVSRLQTGKFVIDKTPTDLAKVVQQEVDGLQPSAMVRNMKLVFKCDKNIPIVDLDEGKFRQVIMNFADNAIYYSRENSTINVNLSIEGNDIVYTVKDKGIGVPENERAQLFTKFYRASNAKKQRPDGTGVGIFLAKKIVDAHGGQIIFESVEGKGSTFGFRIPVK